VNGPEGQIYIVGGGDYQKDDPTLYQLYELNAKKNYEMIKKDNMKHARHGHSATWFGEKFIVVSGSRKIDAHTKVEMYNTDIDLWFELPDLNVGRHYHSSCGFNDRFLYVFCGIANKTRKYINSIEVFDNQKKGSWNLIEQSDKLFPIRQGCGVIQRDNTHILIFGGFQGDFMKDSYLFNVMNNQMFRTKPTPSPTFLF